MFVALHDLRFARGRFALMTGVIVLVAFLVGFLAALTGGLAHASTSAITGLPADRLVLSTADGAEPDFATSTLTPQQVQAWRAVPGVEAAEPLGVATTRAASGGTTAAVTVFGVEPGSRLSPTAALAPGTVVLSAEAQEALGSPSRLDIGGKTYDVVGSGEPGATERDASFAHTPVVWMPLEDWQAVGSTTEQPSATAIALTGTPRGDVTGTTALTLAESRSAIGSFTSENGSLRTIVGFLVAISALVVSAFFSVWTMTRTGDVALLKALGASSRYLLRDAIGQAAVVLAVGVGAGTGLAWLVGRALDGTLPVVLDARTLLTPALLLVLAGLAGAAGAIWRITRIDPHAALAAR